MIVIFTESLSDFPGVSGNVWRCFWLAQLWERWCWRRVGRSRGAASYPTQHRAAPQNGGASAPERRPCRGGELFGLEVRSACERSFCQWTHPYESGSQGVTAALLSHKLHSRGILFGSHSLKNSCFLTVTGK